MTNVNELRAEIARLSGVMPDSTNPKYLTERLAELRGITTVGFQTTRAARSALDRLLEAEMPGKRSGRTRLSELVRAALAEYARNRGHIAEAALLEEVSS